MLLSVIIPCYNAADTIAIQLEALANQHWSEPWEVVVADNRSKDNSREIVEGYRDKLPNLRIVDASARQGQPYALNVGAAAAVGKSIAICDADDEVAPGWVSAMGEALSRYNFVACRVDFAKLNPSWFYAALGKHHPQCKGLEKTWYPPYLPHAGGGTLGVKRSLYESIGDFDESFPCHHDTDYCFRLQMAGVQLHFVPDAVIHIRSRTTLMDIYKQSRNWSQYEVLLFKKYRPAASWDLWNWRGRELWRWHAYVAIWKDFVTRVPHLLSSQEGRAWMAWRLGRQMGLLKGSLMYGVPPSTAGLC